MKEDMYYKYCNGCGLCHSISNTKLIHDEKGFLHPDVVADYSCLNKICPSGGLYTHEIKKECIWGPIEESYLGYANNPVVREKASSGGVLTALCCYLLESQQVDGIIQTSSLDDPVYGTKTVISRNICDVKKCMGSRYSISSPLFSIIQDLVPGEKYAFIGRPCDVSALRSLMKSNEQLKKQIIYLFSFFCAGMPSADAQKKLLKEMGTNENDCIGLQYRGNGWPGYATAIDKDGVKHTMSYADSWGKILGRDVAKACRFCLDGIGLCADIACGDAWYQTSNGEPDFSENDGRNIVFVRTKTGELLLNNVDIVNYLNLTPCDLKEVQLEKIQRYQYERKATMISMIYAMRLLGKPCPQYDIQLLKNYAKNSSFTMLLKRFLGTVKRIIKGKI